jgi:membrane protein
MDAPSPPPDDEETHDGHGGRAPRLPGLMRVLAAYRAGEERALEPSTRAWAKPLQLAGLVAREAARDRTLKQAASLAFVTVLSIIPLLSVVTALLGAWGIFEPGTGEAVQYLEVLFPTSGTQIAVYLQDFSSRGAASIGGLNGMMLLIISILLFNSIESTLTDIWRGAHDRPIVIKFMMFYTLLTLGPILLMISIIQSARAQVLIASRTGLDTGFMDALIPVAAAVVIFTLMNKILPNARVSWRSALLAGMTTALGFEAAKWGFNQYINLIVIDSYNRLYGALGLAPIFMAWVYVTWSVILLGAELSYCHQHFTQLVRTDAPLANLFGGRAAPRHVLDPLAPITILTPIATAWVAGDRGVSETDLRLEAAMPPELVRSVVDALLRDGHLMRMGRDQSTSRELVPARPLDSILLRDVLASYRRRGEDTAHPTLDGLRAEHASAIAEILGDRTARDLVDDRARAALTRALEDAQSTREQTDAGEASAAE